MLKRAIRKLMWLGRTTSTAVGLAVLLTLVVGVASAALGANGGNFILGKTNVATLLTKLGGTQGANGAMLEVQNNNTGTDDTALKLTVQPGEPPMIVNSSTKVNGLNVDYLSGKTSSSFLGSYTYRREAPTDAGTLLGDGSRVKTAYCDTGDRMISGGPASVDAGSKVLDDFPINTYQWQARILPYAGGDNWTVVVLCSDMP
jgi:hypothetical protein